MKTEKELSELKNEVETLNKKLAELSEEELEQVIGGLNEHLNFIDKLRKNSDGRIVYVM